MLFLYHLILWTYFFVHCVLFSREMSFSLVDTAEICSGHLAKVSYFFLFMNLKKKILFSWSNSDVPYTYWK